MNFSVYCFYFEYPNRLLIHFCSHKASQEYALKINKRNAERQYVSGNNLELSKNMYPSILFKLILEFIRFNECTFL